MIKVKNVTKKFDQYVAVDQIDFEMKEGMVFGLIGTNGAGKSTLLRMISGVTKADAGEICVDELPVYDNPEAKEKLWQDCLQNTLWSKASLNNKLKNLVLAEGKNDKKVYLCKTLEDAQDFLYQCIEKDILVWRSACWDIYKENTCYNIEDKRAYYSDRHYYEELRFDIIEYHKGDKF